ncbi:MAG: hypothetical protein V4555_08235 [Acidobacteriota bacterium]
MSIIASLFGAVNFLACITILSVYISKYRKLKRQGVGFETALDAYEFVEHTLLCFWWFVGTVLLYALGLNPFWILAWFLIGLVLTLVLRGIANASGLIGFMATGEMHLRSIAQEVADSMPQPAKR